MKTTEEIIETFNQINNELFKEFGTDSYKIRCKINDLKEECTSPRKHLSDETIEHKAAQFAAQTSWCDVRSLIAGMKLQREVQSKKMSDAEFLRIWSEVF